MRRGTAFARHIVGALAALVTAQAALADAITEFGDAGAMPATAQIARGDGSLTRITGTLPDANDADMYLIEIDRPARFSATTAGSAVFDTQLFLFDVNGFGVAAIDDIRNDSTGYDPRSTLTAGSMPVALPAGFYYVAISSWDLDPYGSGGAIFTDDVHSDTIVGPAGPGGASRIAGWEGAGGTNGSLGAYRIRLTGAHTASAVPEPAATMLITIAGAAWAACRRPR